jgi:hypothetical protein
MSTGKGGKSIWRSTGREEGDLAGEFCFVLFFFHSMFFVFPLKIIFLIRIRILICMILVNDF